MTVKFTYEGLLSEQALYQTFGFMAFVPAVQIDRKHGVITYSDPNNHKNQVVVDVDNLQVSNGTATSGFITSVELITNGKHAVDVTGLHVDYSGQTIAINNDLDQVYYLLADNLTGTVISTGDKYDNNVEVGGGGRATVNAGAGNDNIYVWHHQNAAINGGAGIDIISFDSITDGPPTMGGVAKIDLAKGTGTNPWGGTLTMKNVEGADCFGIAACILKGDNHNNSLIGSHGVDTLMGRGGDDFIRIWAISSADPRATHADGGAGTDTLYAELTDNALGAPMTGSGDTLEFHNRLDLENPSLNTGTFHGATFKNFENFQVSAYQQDTFEFAGSDADETAQGSIGKDDLNGRGGDDVLFGFLGADTLTGGAGADHFQYQGLNNSTVDSSGQDIIKDFKQSQHDKIDLSPMFASQNFGGAYDFIGTKAFDGKASEVRFEHDSDGNTLVLVDDNADKTADMEIKLLGNIDLVKGDFML
jgi:Ca2+-binding RTX toxin-like protein